MKKHFRIFILCVLLFLMTPTICKAEFIDEDMSVPCNLTIEELKAGLLYELEPLAPAFLEAEREYGVNALYLSAIAAQESGWGRYLFKENNIFGFGNKRFNSEEECIYYVAEFISNNYLDPLGDYYKGTTLSDVNYYYNGSNRWYHEVIEVRDSIIMRVEEYRNDLVEKEGTMDNTDILDMIKKAKSYLASCESFESMCSEEDLATAITRTNAARTLLNDLYIIAKIESISL